MAGKRALVLAASSGLGFAIAKQLSLQGAIVSLCSRDASRAEAAAHRIHRETGSQVHAFEADVANRQAIEGLFSKIRMQGGLDLLVCNAGGPPAGNFQVLEESNWTNAFELTLLSVARSIHCALPLFKDAGKGAVLALGSSSVKQPIPNLLLSNVFRPAVHGLIKHLASELGEHKIRLNMLSPGRILTDRTIALDEIRAKRENKSPEQVRAESVAQIPLGRLGDPDEFARTAVFLLSEAATYITGSSIIVDGGMVKAL